MLCIFFPGFFVDINLFKANKERDAELAKNSTNMVENGSSVASGKDGLADEDANLMIKLKFLTYKVKIQREVDIHRTVEKFIFNYRI